MRRKIHLVLATLLLVVGGPIGCGDDGTDVDAVDATPILTDFSQGVAFATYDSLDQSSAVLLASVDGLLAEVNAVNLAAAQDAWRATRLPWEQSEAFLFGPVDTQGLDPKLDSWPVNRIDLDAVLSAVTGPPTFSQDTIDGLEETLKGFHTIEYLLFDNGQGNRELNAIVGALSSQPRRVAYLRAVAASLRNDAMALRNAWAADSGNFIQELINAGRGSMIWISQAAAMQEIVQGMIGIADEVANGKINDPFSQRDASLVESQFSSNSLSDFADNITGIRNAYLGHFDLAGTGQGISNFVRERDPALDAQVLGEIDAAIAAIRSIPEPFRNHLTDSQAEIQAAINAINQLRQTLEGEVLTLVVNAIFEF